jgi:hypothetical protein
MKCAIKDCKNHSHDGLFRGLLCSPCHAFVAGDDGGLYSQAYRNVQSMINGAIAAEREACAKDFEAEADTWAAWPQAGAAKRKGAAAIRNRGDA